MTPVTGELRRLRSGWATRIRIDDQGTRQGFVLTAIPSSDEAAAKERCKAMAQVAARLRAAGHQAKVEPLLQMAAKARAGRSWKSFIDAVDLLCGGRTGEDGSIVEPATVKEVGKDWRSGELHRRYQDHVRPKKERSVQRDEESARLYVDKVIGDHAVADVTLEDCELVMAEIPDGKSASTRRIVGQYLRRLLAMAVYPLRLRTANPIPKGWLPRVAPAKAKECLYPDEDRALLRCARVPLVRRLAYGFLTREGMRTDELARLDWSDVDLERGRVALDENKTDDPRDWTLDPGVARALAMWKETYCPDARPDERVFAERSLPLLVSKLAEQLRRDLRKAGVVREKLYERSASRQPIRAHDLRATFVTIALATGKTETWVADRTGHRSSTMINRYRRKARGWNLGTLDPLDVAIPEFASAPHECPAAPPTRLPDEQVDHENDEETRITGQSTGSVRAFKTAALDHSATPPVFATG